MTEALESRSRVKRKFHARFWIGGGAGDRPADHNVDMKARWYSPGVGRFASADTIVPCSKHSP
jgi:hypothetical protein